MIRVVILAGSLRERSYNTGLARAAVELAPPGAAIELASIRGVPVYDADVEAREFPTVVSQLKDRVASSNGLILASPEYNNSVPGPLKNAIDWMTRPASDIPRIFGDRPVAVVGATPGPGGTVLAQSAWLPVFRTLKTRPWFGGRLSISRAADVFDADGRLTDEKTRGDLARFLAGFVEFISR